MARPFRLRYTDSNGEDQLIGQFLGDAGQDDSIDSGTLKNSGSGETTRLEVKGDNNLLNRFPVEKTSFEDRQEIILDVYSLESNGWIERDRVFAEDTGKIESDDGDYRNDQLAGFEKLVGREKTDTRVGPINTDLADVLESLLNQSSINHEVQTRGDIPSVSNYTFKGNIGKGLRDIHKDYPQVKLWWTGQTNADNEIIVKLEEKGAGDTVETITWPETEGYQLIEYEETDTSPVINRVTINGTDSDGNSVEADTDEFASGSLASDIEDSKDQFGERSLPPRKIGYIESEAHAQELAENLLQLEAQPHLKVALPFQEQNVLNASVDIKDDRYGIDGVFTVVKQRDFFKDSKTEVELSFEKNRTEKSREERQELSEERAALFSNTQENIEFDPTQENEAQGPGSGESYDDQIDNEQSHDVAGTSSETGAIDFQTVNISTDTNFTLDESGSESFNIVSESLSFDGNISQILAFAETDANAGDQFVVRVTTPDAVRPLETYTIGADENGEISISHTSSDPGLDGETIQFVLRNETGESVSVDEQRITVAGEEPHDHDILQETDRALDKITGVENEVAQAFEKLDIIGNKLEEVLEILNLNKSDRE